MKNDPAIQAVRDVRHEISASVNHDPQKLVAYYQQRQKKCQNRLINRTTVEQPPNRHHQCVE